MEKIHVIKLFKGEYSFADVKDYFRGNFRYHLYYSKYFSFLLRAHVKEQIELRIRMMDKECLNSGSCKICGCKTTHLQMANKSCEGNCYPTLMKPFDWKYFKRELGWYRDTVTGKLWVNRNDDETPLKETRLIL